MLGETKLTTPFRRRIQIFFALLGGICLQWALALPALAADSLIGQPAPNLMGRAALGTGLVKLDKLRRDVVFELDEKGKPIRVGGQYQTRTVNYALVLNFFATYCVPCIKEIPTFNKIAKSYEARPVRFLYVNVDVEKSMDEVVRFAKAKGIEIEMMLPSVKNAVEAYKIESLPRIVFVDRDGIVRQVITGFQEDLARQVDEVLVTILPPSS
jgi:thiol-disulfide isomerase/thioredoxin